MASFHSISRRVHLSRASNERLGGVRAALVLATLVATTAAVVPAQALTPSQRVDLKVLVLSADGFESSFAAWTKALDREGVPYDTLIANTAPPIDAATLTKSATHARYQAVVLATGGLVQCDWVSCYSALDPAEWKALNAYQAAFGIRRVTAYAYPTPEYGLNWPFSAGDLSGTVAKLTAAGSAVFPYLTGPVPMDAGTYGYYAEPLVAGTAASGFETLVAGPAGAGGTASSLAGIYHRPDGFDELVVTYATNAYQMQAMLLAHGLIAWATHGVRLGYQRNYFMMHIDDVFLPDDRWDMVDKVTYEDDGVKNPLIRMVPSDVDRALKWQAQTGLQLDMAFNGGGSVDAVEANGSDPLTDYFLAKRGAFTWINHTYSHPNLDALTATEIYNEINLNLQWARSKRLYTRRDELVTGEHSGLANAGMPAALNAAGVRWVAADNSKQPESYTVGKATTIPRHPSNVYYNVATFAEQLDEYNHIYFFACLNTPWTTCLSQPATWEQYVDSEASIMLRHVLTNDPRPHFAHQSNLAEDGTMYPVVNEMLARYKTYVSVPLAQPYYRQSGVLMQRHTRWGAASMGPAATMTDAYYQAGRVYVRSSKPVILPVTGATAGSLYGGEKAGWFSLPANQLRYVTVAAPF